MLFCRLGGQHVLRKLEWRDRISAFHAGRWAHLLAQAGDGCVVTSAFNGLQRKALRKRRRIAKQAPCGTNAQTNPRYHETRVDKLTATSLASSVADAARWNGWACHRRVPTPLVLARSATWRVSACLCWARVLSQEVYVLHMLCAGFDPCLSVAPC